MSDRNIRPYGHPSRKAPRTRHESGMNQRELRWKSDGHTVRVQDDPREGRGALPLSPVAVEEDDTVQMTAIVEEYAELVE